MKINNLKNYIKLCLLLSIVIVLIIDVSSKRKLKKHKRKEAVETNNGPTTGSTTNTDTTKPTVESGGSSDVNAATLGKMTNVVLPPCFHDKSLNKKVYSEYAETLQKCVYDHIMGPHLLKLKEDADKCYVPRKSSGILIKLLRGVIEYGENGFYDREDSTEWKKFKVEIASDQCPKGFQAKVVQGIKDNQGNIKLFINKIILPRIRRRLRKAGLDL